MIAHVFNGARGRFLGTPGDDFVEHIFQKVDSTNQLFEKYVQGNRPGVPKNLPLAPLKTCAIDRSRGVDVFKKNVC